MFLAIFLNLRNHIKVHIWCLKYHVKDHSDFLETISKIIQFNNCDNGLKNLHLDAVFLAIFQNLRNHIKVHIWCLKYHIKDHSDFFETISKIIQFNICDNGLKSLHLVAVFLAIFLNLRNYIKIHIWCLKYHIKDHSDFFETISKIIQLTICGNVVKSIHLVVVLNFLLILRNYIQDHLWCLRYHIQDHKCSIGGKNIENVLLCLNYQFHVKS